MCQWVKRWGFRHLFTLTENLADVWSGFITWSEIIPPLVSLWWLTLTNMFFTVYKLLVLFSPTYGDKCSLHTSFSFLWATVKAKPQSFDSPPYNARACMQLRAQCALLIEAVNQIFGGHRILFLAAVGES